jgi:serpin B
MYEQLRQQPGNLFFSPFSIRTAVAMTHAGARGVTAAQMKAALSISSKDEQPHNAFAETIERLGTADGDKYEMSVANSLWCQDGTSLQPDFLDVVARLYGGHASLLDFPKRG